MSIQELESKVQRFISNKDIIAEKTAENKNLMDEIYSGMARLNLADLVVQLPFSEDNEFISVKIRDKKTKRLDKPTLAAKAEVDKSELTTYGISYYTKAGKITPEMIQENTHKIVDSVVKIKKKKPRKKKNKGGK
ncbi:hypothetical protein D3C74_49050 [compost metagenome]